MNAGERRRDERIAKLSDAALLKAIADDGTAELSEKEAAAFADMFGFVRAGSTLSKKQRRWAEETLRKLTPIRASDCPKGADVEIPAVLKNLPLKPPGCARG